MAGFFIHLTREHLFSIMVECNVFNNMDLYKKRLEKLIKFYRKNNYIPSYDDLLGIFELSSKGSLYKYIQKFIDKGYLIKGENGKLVATAKLSGLRVLGVVQAGFPSPAEEELADLTNLKAVYDKVQEKLGEAG